MKQPKEYKKMSERKKNIIKLIILLFFVGVTVLFYVFSTELFSETSVFKNQVSANQTLQKLYESIPAIFKCIQIFTIFVLIFMITKIIFSRIFARSRKGITIVKLVCSFLKYLLGVIAILMMLSAFGVDTTTLLASVGILTLVIGLGAQSLIADVIAGMFIVFESEFEVGDIVVIDGWRGTVSEIGIRATRIVDAGGNIKIINNSAISSVINQTEQHSIAKCIVGIDYGESLEHVEKIINENLPKMKKNIPDIIEGPIYRGVTALNTSSVDLLFIAKCEEENIYQVQRDMNRAIKLIFDANDINIPFTQVVVNEASPKKDLRHNSYSKNDNK
ncbi:MAG: mechanosensitive ion channel family protein [Bacilli bacterium]|nr:mechanosensitive ion channel family protein [Bacilli bacterium]